MDVFWFSLAGTGALIVWALMGVQVSHLFDALVRFDDNRSLLPRNERLLIGLLWPLSLCVLGMILFGVLVCGWWDGKGK